MDNNELHKLLNQIHDEINNTQEVDEKGSELLRDLEGDIRKLLERSAEKSDEMHPPMINALEETIQHFEVTHPSLTVLISKLLDTLSNSGI